MKRSFLFTIASLVFYSLTSIAGPIQETSLAEEQYPEAKLVILEGAVDSIANVLTTRPFARFASFFTQHDPNGISPLKCVDKYPENLPTVFITSEVDTTVPCENTINIAQTLAAKGKNDVYLLKLKRSSHPNYMFDDPEDRDTYECFIHAIYKKYNIEHNSELASRGEQFLQESILREVNPQEEYGLYKRVG